MRIDALLKARADEALSRAGISSSEVIRAVYHRAATMGSSLTSLDDLLGSERAAPSEERLRREAAFERSGHIFQDVLARHGFSVDLDAVRPMADEEIEKAYRQDCLAEHE